jgi:hypothetical protein
VRRRSAHYSDIVRVNAHIAVQAIAHFFDEALTLRSSRVVAFADVEEPNDVCCE